jgi:uncharacterized membrane protein YkvA (DUF1232 family)
MGSHEASLYVLGIENGKLIIENFFKMTAVNRVIDWLSAPYTLFLVLRDGSASTETRIKAGVILGIMAFYVLNPLDLIPDLHPLLGWVDDLLIMPVGMAIAQRTVPDINVGAVRAGARARVKKAVLWTLVAAAGLMVIGTMLFALLALQLLS